MTIGKCKLCEHRKQLAKAHIIPRSFSLKVKGDSKALLEARSGGGKDIDNWQNGIWDDGILCSDCDNGFSQWDDYSFKILGKPPGNNSFPKDDLEMQAFVLKDLNYEVLKLFVLSVLWKASVSTQPFFSGLDLGEHYEPKIREVIRNKSAGGWDCYPIILTRLVGQRTPNAMFPPYRQRSPEGINFCVIFLPSIKITIKVDQRPLPKILETVALRAQPENILLPNKPHDIEIQTLRDSAEIFRRWIRSTSGKRRDPDI